MGSSFWEPPNFINQIGSGPPLPRNLARKTRWLSKTPTKPENAEPRTLCTKSEGNAAAHTNIRKDLTQGFQFQKREIGLAIKGTDKNPRTSKNEFDSNTDWDSHIFDLRPGFLSFSSHGLGSNPYWDSRIFDLRPGILSFLLSVFVAVFRQVFRELISMGGSFVPFSSGFYGQTFFRFSLSFSLSPCFPPTSGHKRGAKHFNLPIPWPFGPVEEIENIRDHEATREGYRTLTVRPKLYQIFTIPNPKRANAYPKALVDHFSNQEAQGERDMHSLCAGKILGK